VEAYDLGAEGEKELRLKGFKLRLNKATAQTLTVTTARAILRLPLAIVINHQAPLLRLARLDWQRPMIL
jgi:hypothetical protein